MLVYGKNILKELDTKKIKKAYIASNNYVEYLKSNRIKYEFVDKKRLDKMVDGNHQNVVLDIFDYDYYKISDIDSDFIVVLDHIQDPHNLGAIIRTCECAGIKNIIIPKDRSALINDTVMKISVGALEYVKIIMVNNINKLGGVKCDPSESDFAYTERPSAHISVRKVAFLVSALWFY